MSVSCPSIGKKAERIWILMPDNGAPGNVGTAILWPNEALTQPNHQAPVHPSGEGTSQGNAPGHCTRGVSNSGRLRQMVGRRGGLHCAKENGQAPHPQGGVPMASINNITHSV